MGTVVFKRPPRQPGPQLPHGELPLEPPPELPEPASPNVMRLLMILPMVAGAGAMAFMFAGRGGGPLQYVVGAMFGISMLGMMVVTMTTSSGNKTAEVIA